MLRSKRGFASTIRDKYGNTQISQENLLVVKVMPEEGLLLVRGSIPGARNTLLTVRTSKKKWKREKAAD